MQPKFLKCGHWGAHTIKQSYRAKEIEEKEAKVVLEEHFWEEVVKAGRDRVKCEERNWFIHECLPRV